MKKTNQHNRIAPFAGAFLICLQCFTVSAQITKINGKVSDAKTGEALPFVNVIFPGTSIGTITDLEGKYKIETSSPGDSLMASFVGYLAQSKAVIKQQKQIINFELEVNSVQLSEIVILPGENPAHILLRKIIEKKPENNPSRLDFYEYEVYNKIEFDMNNITENFKNQKILKPFKFIFDYTDTSEINGKVFLPIFISESLSDVHFRKSPPLRREVIKGTKISGIENESVTQFMGDLYQNINIYENYIPILGKSFISPISNSGLLFYKYYLNDSMFIGNKWCYQVNFIAKRKQELTFYGDYWVNDTSFAILKMEMRVADDANINFAKDVYLKQEFSFVNDSAWMLTNDKFLVDFSITENGMGVFGTKSTTYKNFVVNTPREKDFYERTKEVTVLDSASARTDDFWKQNRHQKLTKNEETIYQMMDTIKQVPAFKTFYDIIYLFVSGYQTIGKFELGPYFTFYSFNGVEGNRFRVGARTSNAFSTRLQLEGYAAYGFKDQRMKYGGGFQYFLTKQPRRQLIGASYKNDLEQLGQSQNAFREDNVFASFLRRNIFNKLTRVEEIKGFYEMEWFPGLSNRLVFVHRKLVPAGPFEYKYINEGHLPDNDIKTSEIRLNTRFAYREKFVSGEFDRISLGTKYPVVQALYAYGIPRVLNSQFEFHRLNLSISHWFRINPIGYSEYIIEAGKIFGKLPYPLLTLHQGNETYMYDDFAYNMMNYIEFVSDMFVSGFYTHHFNGFFFNRIPLLRKLKWREVISAKGLIGRVSDQNREVMVFPTTLTNLSKPYGEAGFGIENIFKVIRIDFLWRLSFLEHPGIQKFGVRGSFRFNF